VQLDCLIETQPWTGLYGTCSHGGCVSGTVSRSRRRKTYSSYSTLVGDGRGLGACGSPSKITSRVSKSYLQTTVA
jgi:hypothetical protein